MPQARAAGAVEASTASVQCPCTAWKYRQVAQAMATSGWSGPSVASRDLEAALVERLGLRIPALSCVQDRQVVQAGGHVGVVGPELRLPDLEAAFEERLGLRIPALA